MSHIYNRQSIRHYKSDPVPQALLTELLKAGMYAPSAKDRRPVEYILITGDEGRQKLFNSHPYAQFLLSAPAIIMVCANLDKEYDEALAALDGAAATENILIRATELGLGSCWVLLHPSIELCDQARSDFGIPDEVLPVAIVTVGYSKETAPIADKYDESIIHIEKY